MAFPFCFIAQLLGVFFFHTFWLNYLAGIYYNYDSSTNKYHNSIMADQMAGQWYLKACDLGQSPSDRVMIVPSCRLGNLVAIVIG